MRKFVKFNTILLVILAMSCFVYAEESPTIVQEHVVVPQNVTELDPEKASFFLTVQKIYRRAELSDVEKNQVQNIKRGIIVLAVASAGITSLYMWGDKVYNQIRGIYFNNNAQEQNSNESGSSSDDEKHINSDEIEDPLDGSSIFVEQSTNSTLSQLQNQDLEEEEDDGYSFVGNLFKTVGAATGKKIKHGQGVGAGKTMRQGLKNKHQGSNSKAVSNIETDPEKIKQKEEEIAKKFAMMYQPPTDPQDTQAQQEIAISTTNRPALPLNDIVQQKYSVLKAGKTGARIKKAEDARQKSIDQAKNNTVESPGFNLKEAIPVKTYEILPDDRQGSENWES